MRTTRHEGSGPASPGREGATPPRGVILPAAVLGFLLVPVLVGAQLSPSGAPASDQARAARGGRATQSGEGDDARAVRLAAAATPGTAADRRSLARRLAEMLEAVQQHHLDGDQDDTRLVHGAIRGMLETLDPHTHFLDPDSYRTMRESQDGSFFGLGIIISVRSDEEGKRRLTVISPIEGMPARRLGVRPGDIIAGIDGESTEGLSLDGAVAKLRGQKGTSVTITIERSHETFDLVVERAEIPTESVSHSFMIRPDVGFVRIKDFTKTTTSELQQSIRDLRQSGMRKLILDLRDNPGGLLDEAVTVSSTFLAPSQLVVETRGRVPGANESHVAERGGDRLPDDIPLIVLVNRGSASASEIVSGAVQDHDRGLVVGSTTWGKGLVQSVYNLSGESGLALTTARYYTPSGRQIQRDYRSSYFDYYYPREGQTPHGEKHVTDGGRSVYSGGGIQPDVLVAAKEPHELVQRLIRRSVFFRYANQRHLVEREGQVQPGFELSPAELTEFRAFLESEGNAVSDADWADAQRDIELQLTYEIASAHLGLLEAFRVMSEADPQVQAALELWDHATPKAIVADARAGKTPVYGPEDEVTDAQHLVAEKGAGPTGMDEEAAGSDAGGDRP